jgi:hypothetical protein
LRAEPFGPPLCLKRQMLPFALELHRGDRDPGIGGAPVRGLQRPPGLGPADQGAVPRGDLLPDPVFYLVVASATSKNWSYRYWKDGKQRWLGLGSVKEVSLKEARLARDAARLRVKGDRSTPGVDIVQERSARRVRKRRP